MIREDFGEDEDFRLAEEGRKDLDRKTGQQSEQRYMNKGENQARQM